MNKEEFVDKLIKNNIDKNCFIIGSGNKCDPLFRFSKEPVSERFAVKLFQHKHFAVFWNLERQRMCTNRVTKSVEISKDCYDRLNGDDIFVAEYKELEKRGSGKWHKICIVSFNCIDRFLENYYEYIKFNDCDDSFPKAIKISDVEDEMESDMIRRKRYSTTKWKRDSRFSEKVLKSYGYKCAVCRCCIRSVLQAAHEHGYEPNETNWDDPLHGICLCANHHLMYDRNLIEIDKTNNTFSINNHEIESESLINCFFKDYYGILLQQNFMED